MDHAITVLYWLLALFGLVFVTGCVRAIRTAPPGGSIVPSPFQILVGVVTDFFDSLGIGSFATTTAFYRARRTIDDRLLPGTLNVGHTLPTIAQAYLFFERVEVDRTTLVAMIAAAVVGAWTGAGFVAKWRRSRVQAVMGAALLAIGAVIVIRQLHDPKGGDAKGVTGIVLAAGVAGNFVLGVLMTMGIGLYAPCLLLVCLLGMNPTTGFPIMMGSCAFLMPLASLRFLRERSCDLRACAGLTLGGIPAVFAATYLVTNLDLKVVKWLVLVVVVYTAISLLLAARRSAGSSADAEVRT